MGAWGEPGAGVCEVEAAGTVECFFGGSRWLAAGQVAVVVVVMAGAVDGEPPRAGVAGVAEPAQGQAGAVGQLAADVGELAVETYIDAGELGPAVAGAGAQLLAQAGPGRCGRAGHQPSMTAQAAARADAARRAVMRRIRSSSPARVNFQSNGVAVVL